eukprot:107825-Rhodomonas_salina.1
MPTQKRTVVAGEEYVREEQHKKCPKVSPRKGKGKASTLHALGCIGVDTDKKRKKGKKRKVGTKRVRLDSSLEEEEGSLEEAEEEEEQDTDEEESGSEEEDEEEEDEDEEGCSSKMKKKKAAAKRGKGSIGWQGCESGKGKKSKKKKREERVPPAGAVIAPPTVFTDPDRINKRKFEEKKWRQRKAEGQFEEVMNELGLIDVDVATWRQLTPIQLENHQSWWYKELIKFRTVLQEKDQPKNVVVKSKEDYDKTVKK